MKPGIERTYQVLGEFIAARMPEEWAVAWVVAEIDGDSGGTTYGSYKTAATPNTSVSSFETDGTVYEAFNEMRRLLTVPGKEPWTTAVFTLLPTGRFWTDFDYGPLEGSPIDRILALDARKNAEEVGG